MFRDGNLIFPLLIDCHVHFREPGLTHKGTMASESAAALAGGVGTVCDMPNTVPPTVTLEALSEKIRLARKMPIDIRFFFGITEHRHLIALRNLWVRKDAAIAMLREKCVGAKLYLDHSTGNQKAEGSTAEETFALCGELGIPLVAHCEDAEMNEALRLKASKAKDVAQHSKIRPAESEVRAVEHAIILARRYGTPFHVAHLSTAGALALVRDAKKEGLTVTCEVAPHHLFLTEDDYETLGTLGKMNPPLRSQKDRDALWTGIADGTVDCVATDHAPHTLEEKRSGDPLAAPSGVPGVATMLPLLLSVAVGQWPHPTSAPPKKIQFSYEDILRLCFTNPNKIFSLGKSDEAVTTIDPKKEWTIRASEIPSTCGWTPYEGWKTKGKVMEVR